MGLSNHLTDASSDSIPILLMVAAAGWVSYFRSLLFCLLRSVGLDRLHPADHPSPLFSTVESGLASLVILADHLNSNRSFSYVGNGAEEEGAAVVFAPAEETRRRGVAPDCVVCLCRLAEGDRVRRLSCCHVFHSECLDGWFDQMKFSCPLCRSPLVTEERRADGERRIGTELVAWLTPY